MPAGSPYSADPRLTDGRAGDHKKIRHGHRSGRDGNRSPCLKGRREYILVDLSPTSLLDTPLWQGDRLPTDYGHGFTF